MKINSGTRLPMSSRKANSQPSPRLFSICLPNAAYWPIRKFGMTKSGRPRKIKSRKLITIRALECFPSAIEEELERPLGNLDALLDYVDIELSLNNKKLESRLESIEKSRLLLDRLNEALSILKKKPDNGEKMYELIYLTYIAPEKLSHADLLYRLDISARHYYRLRTQAIGIISLRLWSVPAAEMDSWLELLTLLEDLC